MRARRMTALVAATAGAMIMTMTAASAFQTHAGTFTDDDGNTHEANIEAIFDANLTDGCNPPDNDEYCPSDFVTRGQMAKFIDRARGFDDATEDHFTDDEDSIFEPHINDIAEANVVHGCNPPDNDEYCPTNFVTRGQMAKFITNAFNLERQSDADHFTDDEDSTFEHHINTLKDNGIVKGCNPPENDEYCPERNVTRAEMATFLANALDISHADPTPFGNETCDAAYFPCVPTVEEFGDLDCDDIRAEYPEGVQHDSDFGDPHKLNTDGDDKACETA